MIIYDFVSRLLLYLELGTWNGEEIFPRLPLTDQERILLFVLRSSLRDWQTILRRQGSGFQSSIHFQDYECFRECIHHNFRRDAAVGAGTVSPHDLVQAERQMTESLRQIRTEYYLERT